MIVRVDKAGRDDETVRFDQPRACWYLYLIAFSRRDDGVAFKNDNRIRDRRAARAVDQRGAYDRCCIVSRARRK